MEQSQKAEIGQRIRDLREASPHTNRSIAEEVGVSERAVTGWISGRGIAWDHVVAVAELFDVDRNWLWSGRHKGDTPDLMGDLSAPVSSADLARVEQNLLGKIAELAGEVAKVQAALSAQQESEPRSGRRLAGNDK